jgi:hypothetical protein
LLIFNNVIESAIWRVFSTRAGKKPVSRFAFDDSTAKNLWKILTEWHSTLQSAIVDLE